MNQNIYEQLDKSVKIAFRIHCDYRREFDNTMMKDLCKVFNIKHSYFMVGYGRI